MAYQNQIDRFDIERGDVLSLTREDVTRLADYWEISHPILRELFTWFLGGPDKPMQDPRDDMHLRALKEHQRANAARRYDYLLAQRERKTGKGKNHGQPRTTTDTSKEEDEEEVKVKISVSDKSSLRADASTPASTADASGVGSSSRQPLRCARCRTFYDTEVQWSDVCTEAEFRADPIRYLCDDAWCIEEKPELAQNAYRKYLRELGPDSFCTTAWDFFKERIEKKCKEAETHCAYVRELLKAVPNLRELKRDERVTKQDAFDNGDGQHLLYARYMTAKAVCNFGGKVLVSRLKNKALAMGLG